MEAFAPLHRYQPGRPHWWQWLTVLSLDAPLVAVVWQDALARTGRVPLRWPHGFVLGAAVWLAYVADRWIEGWRLAPDLVLTQRHWFYQRWRWPVAVVWLTVLATAFGVALARLTRAEFAAGLLVLGPVLVYLLSHQLIHRGHPKRIPKEICVALLFAAGTICFVVAQRPAAIVDTAPVLAMFALLCFANCSLISGWENEVDRAHGQTSFALQFPTGVTRVRRLPWLLAAAGLILCFLPGPTPPGIAACAAASGALLGTIDQCHHLLGRQLSRALADLTLLTPGLIALGSLLATR